MQASWPASPAGNAGNGEIDIWLLQNLMGTGNFMGTTQTCGVILPDMALNVLAGALFGGDTVSIQFPTSVWTSPSMPKFQTTGTSMAWGMGSFTINPTTAMIGVRLPMGTDPSTAMWPSSTWSFPMGTMFPDDDGDGKPGITTTSPTGMMNGHTYAYPPTDFGGGKADKVYVGTRSTIGLNGMWTDSCNLSGTAMVPQFDNHVVGCHVLNGGDCTTGMAGTQADFIDQNRPIYTLGSATFTAKVLTMTSPTCSDVQTAVP